VHIMNSCKYGIKKFYNIVPWGLDYKTFYSRNYSVSLKARVFVTVSHFHPSLIFAGKAEPYPGFANIILGLKCLTMGNVLAFYGRELILAVKFYSNRPTDILA